MSNRLAELFVDIVARDKTGATFQNIKNAAQQLTVGMSAAGRTAHSAMIAGMSSAGIQASSAVKARQQEIESLEQARGMRRSVALREELQLIQDIGGRRKLSLDAGGTPQGIALASQMHRMDEIAAWRRSIIEQGRFAGNLHEIGKRLEPLRMLAGMSLLGGGFGLAGLASAASPQIWDTLTGSVKLLASEIGRGLLPNVVELIRWIQSLTVWYRSLDESTKRFVGGTIFWTTVIGGAATAIGLMTHAIYLASLGLHRLAVAAGMASAAQGAAGTTAMGTVAATATATSVGTTGATVPQLFAIAAALKSVVDFGGLIYDAATMEGGMTEAVWTNQSMLVRLGRWIGEGLGATRPPQFIDPVSAAGYTKEGGPGGDNPLLSNFRFQPRMGGIEDAWRNVQMASLGLSPIEQRLLRNHLEAMQVWNQIAGNTSPNNANWFGAIGNFVGGAS